jgi:hypothetical protein
MLCATNGHVAAGVAAKLSKGSWNPTDAEEMRRRVDFRWQSALAVHPFLLGTTGTIGAHVEWVEPPQERGYARFIGINEKYVAHCEGDAPDIAAVVPTPERYGFEQSKWPMKSIQKLLAALAKPPPEVRMFVRAFRRDFADLIVKNGQMYRRYSRTLEPPYKWHDMPLGVDIPMGRDQEIGFNHHLVVDLLAPVVKFLDGDVTIVASHALAPMGFYLYQRQQLVWFGVAMPMRLD